MTLFNKDLEQNRLVGLLAVWGFVKHGLKKSVSGDESVFVRDFRPREAKGNPCLTYPYIGIDSRKFIVPIYPKYHTELFPDSILRT